MLVLLEKDSESGEQIAGLVQNITSTGALLACDMMTIISVT
jgi:hypothetical protein